MLGTRYLVLLYQNTLSFDHYPVAWESATACGPEHANLPFRKFSGFQNCGIEPVTPIMENTEVSGSKPLSHAGTHHTVSIFVGSCSSDLRVTFLIKVNCRLDNWFWIIGIPKNIWWIISFVILSSFTCFIVTQSILLMLQCRKTSSLFRSETRRDYLSHTHRRRFMGMARKIKYFMQRSTDVSLQKWFNAPIDEEAEASLLSTS